MRSIVNYSLGSLTMTFQQAGESVLYYAYKPQSSQTTTTTIFKHVDPSKFVSADRSQSKAGSPRKRVHSETDQEADPSAKHRRAPRTCLKCRRMDCPGRWKVDKCTVSNSLFLPPSELLLSQRCSICRIPVRLLHLRYHPNWQRERYRVGADEL